MSAPTIERSIRGALHREPALPRLPFTARAVALLRDGWRAYWERRARRATLLILCSLDERTLRDIGISSGEVHSVVYGGCDRLRHYDARWPWHRKG